MIREQRSNYTAKEKIAILREVLIELADNRKVAVSSHLPKEGARFQERFLLLKPILDLLNQLVFRQATIIVIASRLTVLQNIPVVHNPLTIIYSTHI